MTMLAIKKMKSCKECPYSHSIEYEKYIIYYCGKNDRAISSQKKNTKVSIPKWCPLREFNLIK